MSPNDRARALHACSDRYVGDAYRKCQLENAPYPPAKSGRPWSYVNVMDTTKALRGVGASGEHPKPPHYGAVWESLCFRNGVSPETRAALADWVTRQKQIESTRTKEDEVRENARRVAKVAARNGTLQEMVAALRRDGDPESYAIKMEMLLETQMCFGGEPDPKGESYFPYSSPHDPRITDDMRAQAAAAAFHELMRRYTEFWAVHDAVAVKTGKYPSVDHGLVARKPIGTGIGGGLYAYDNEFYDGEAWACLLASKGVVSEDLCPWEAPNKLKPAKPLNFKGS